MTGNGLLTPGRAAQEFHVSAATLRRWEDLGHITAMRQPNGSRLYNAASIERWMGTHTDPAVSPDDVRPFLEAAAGALALPVPAHPADDDQYWVMLGSHALLVLDSLRVLLGHMDDPAAMNAAGAPLRAIASQPPPYQAAS